MAAPDTQRYESLTRRHGVRVVCAASLEECVLAVGDVVGHENIVSASRMNSAVVVFVNSVDKAVKIVQNGISVNNEHILVSPLSSPAKKVVLSNVPPFISDSVIAAELSRYGRLVSPIKKIPLGCKSPLIKHLVSFRRVVFMIFKEGVEELNVIFKFRVENFDYNIFASSDTDIKCFKCGAMGHLVRACPERQNDPDAPVRPGQDSTVPAVAVPPATTARPPTEGPGNAAEPEPKVNESQAQPAIQESPETTSTPKATCSTKPDRGEPNVTQPAPASPSTTDKVSEGSGAALESPVLSAMGTRAKSRQLEAAATALSQGDEADIEMEEEPLFKTPKRKKDHKRGGKKLPKKDTETESDSDGYISDSVLILTPEEERMPVVYSEESIHSFLEKTKGGSKIKLEEHFPNKRQFIHDVKYYKKHKAFIDREIFRIKKWITKINKELAEEDFLE
ncbi:uncharacterized protein Hap1MRO34_019449 [Clarias gariepinus]